MRKLYTFKFTFLLFAAVLIVSACSDETPSGEAPTIPDLSEVRPSFDFFQQNNTTAASAMGENFQIASSLAQSMELLMTTFSSLPESFLGLAREEEPDFNDGVWTWEYTQSAQGESVTVRLEAEQTNTRVNWAMFISADTQEQNFDDYKLFDGFVLTDSNEGEWNIYAFEEGISIQPVMTYDWIIESDDVASFNFTFDDNSASSMSYVKNSPDNTLTINGSSETTVIYWNSSTGAGYFDTTGEDRICWDSSSNNTPCTSA